MAGWTVVALRTVLAIALLGSVAVQGVFAALPWLDQGAAPVWLRLALSVVGVGGVLCLQVIGVCIWQLLTRVRRATVFSIDSFRYVDAVIAALVVAAALVFSLAVLARFANHAVPGDEVAPGLVLMVCAAALVTGGVALVVYVLRVLLAQAVSLDAETKQLRSELDVVI